METIEKLLEDGWKVLTDYNYYGVTCFLYGKGDERKLYHPKEGKFVFEYTLDRPGVTCKL